VDDLGESYVTDTSPTNRGRVVCGTLSHGEQGLLFVERIPCSLSGLHADHGPGPHWARQWATGNRREG
jgi:hypothetical protein